MRIGIIADIHGNLPAFVRVMTRLKALGADEWLWCLGDVVGYGPYPNECIELLQDYNHICMPGNHDWGAVGKTERVLFNDEAGFVLDWTMRVLKPEHKEWLAGLAAMGEAENTPFTLVHASPREPIWEYVVEAHEAKVCFPFFATPYCLLGHTHLPLAFRLGADGEVTRAEPEAGEIVKLGSERMIMNPGSVGQPRNGDSRAHFAVYDTDAGTVQYERAEYPIILTQARMRDLDFPSRLIHRLEDGS